jgi:hypothetical protein
MSDDDEPVAPQDASLENSGIGTIDEVAMALASDRGSF